jgi:hypothetical protein
LTTAWKSALHSFSSGGPPLLLSPAVLTVLLSLSLADAGWVVSPVSPLVKVAEAAVVLVVAVVPVALPWLSLIESLCDPPSVGTDAVALASVIAVVPV